MTSQTLRLLLVDDHAVVRAGLAALLGKQPGLEICGQAGNGHAAVSRFEELRPDVTVMDLQMPGLDGAGAIAKIKERDPHARVLVLTTYETDDDIERALRAGALGYVLKDAELDELLRAIRDVHAGRTYVAQTVASRLADRLTHVPLSPRELAVLRLVTAGKTNKEIGGMLSITEATVKAHLTRLFDKLGVSNRTEAIAAAARRGLVRL